MTKLKDSGYMVRHHKDIMIRSIAVYKESYALIYIVTLLDNFLRHSLNIIVEIHVYKMHIVIKGVL